MRLVYLRFTEIEQDGQCYQVQHVDIIQRPWRIDDLIAFINSCAREGSQCVPLTPNTFSINYPDHCDYGMTIRAKDVFVLHE